MKQIKNFRYGLSSYGSAWSLIAKNKMKRYFLFPLLLNIIFYLVGFELADVLTNNVLVHIEDYLQPESWDFMGSELLADTMHFILWLILKIFTFLFIAFVGGHVVLICMSPILAIVSEKAEFVLSQKEYPFNLKQLISDTLRGVKIAIRNFLLELLVIIVLFILGFIPVVGLISAPILFFVASYYYGFSFLDYNLERKKYSYQQSVRFMKEHKGLVIGNGLFFSLLLMIPFIGVTLAAFGAIISTVAATISLHKKEQIEEQNKAVLA